MPKYLHGKRWTGLEDTKLKDGKTLDQVAKHVPGPSVISDRCIIRKTWINTSGLVRQISHDSVTRLQLGEEISKEAQHPLALGSRENEFKVKIEEIETEAAGPRIRAF
ncbi:MAG: hypothetical protein Q9219_007222 [cf. Caloplaca sp. 3 TL-2023]